METHGQSCEDWQTTTFGLSRRSMLFAGAMLLGAPGLVAAAKPSARVSRERSIADIPFSKLNAPTQKKLRSVLDNYSIYRRLPVQVIPADPELHLFLIRYPEVVVNMWELMGITKVQIRRVGPYISQASDGAGTISTVELAYGDRDTHVIYCKGHYEGTLVRKRIEGECVLLLKTSYKTADDGRTYITNRLDVFVVIHNVGAELIARTLQPVIGKTADHNFVASTKFLGQISQQAAINRSGMQRLASRLTRIDGRLQHEFSRIAMAANDRARVRAEQNAIKPQMLRTLTSE
jgi:hypothetical protein